MPTNTTNNYFSKPAVGGDTDTWGTTLNANWDAVDSIVTGGTSITRLGIGTTNTTLPLICNAASATAIAASFSGLVGIGTTSPDQKLQVDGNIRLGDTAVGVDDDEDYNITTGGQLTIHANDSGGNQNYVSLNLSCGNANGSEAASSRISCIVNDDEKMRIDSSGNVGIGESVPTSKLQVTNGDFRIKSTYPRIYLEDTNNNSDYSIINTNGAFVIFDDTTGLNRIQIGATGEVDINNYLRTDRIDCRTGQQLVLNAGESGSYAEGQSGEKVYVNAEEGLEVNTTPPSNNWASGWTGRKTAVLRGDNLSVQGGATFDGGTSTTIDVISDAGGTSTLRLYGNGQGNGRVFVGQSTTYGGGIEYCGNDDPILSDAGADRLSLYRRDNGTNVWTARNTVTNNDWEFRGKVKANSLEGTLVQSIFNQIYPVGSIFTTTSDSFDPETAFGGTWSLHGGGKVLVGDNNTTTYSVGQTGGSSTHDHTTTITRDGWGAAGPGLGTAPSGRLITGSGLAEGTEYLSSLRYASGDNAFNSDEETNFPPYIVVKFWMRDTLAT